MLRKLSIGLVLMLGACGTARLVQQTQYGGVIALQGDRNKAMDDANRMMSQQCGPNNYAITQQGEEVIGTDTTYDQSTAARSNKSGTRAASETSGGESTRNATEWRVHYQCNGAPAPAPAPGPTDGAGGPAPTSAPGY